MTVLRHLLFLLCTLSPVCVLGQVPSRPVERDSRIIGQYPLNPSSAIPAGQATQQNPGYIEDRGAVLASGSTFGAVSQAQLSQAAPQPEVPSDPMPNVARRYSSPIWQTSQSGGCYGIMGAIKQPGVYYDKQERVLLSKILELAGGSTDDASGAVRIVRQGRGGLQTFLSPDSRYELLNGDVVLLESHRRNGQPGLQQFSSTLQGLPNAGQRSSSVDSSSKPGEGPAYLAFVNLRAAPIVVPVPNDATITAVLTWLRQDLKSPPFVRVIPPIPLVRRDASLPEEQQLLETGSVLVFDPSTVNRNRLPEFPPVIGVNAANTDEPAPKTAEPARIEKAPSESPRAVPDLQPPSVQHERPASRATRPPPMKTSTTPLDSTVRPVPRREAAQSDAPARSENHSWRGGPALLMPQNNGGRRPQPTSPDLGARQPAPSEELNSDTDRQTEATAASFEGQPMSWNSRPTAEAGENAQEFEHAAVVQAHGGQHHLDEGIQAGPALELPRPIPNILHEPATIPPESNGTGAIAIRSLPENSGMRIVWFSIGAMFLLAVILWCLLRWDRRRYVHSRVAANRPLATHRNTSAFGKRTAVLLSERQPLRRTDTGIQMNDQGSNVPPASSEAREPAIPLPVRSISPREHALRAHFRKAWLERGQQNRATDSPAETAETQQAGQPLTKEAPTTVPTPHASMAAPTGKSSDVLDRVLLARRGQISSE